jgi:hypothetical protein
VLGFASALGRARGFRFHQQRESQAPLNFRVISSASVIRREPVE